jgi:hypothetical protein
LRGVEGDVGVVAVGGARGDIAATLAVGAGARTPAGGAAGQLVEVGLELARGKLLAGVDLLPAFPPVGVIVLKGVLGAGVGLTDVRRLLLLRLRR